MKNGNKTTQENLNFFQKGVSCSHREEEKREPSRTEAALPTSFPYSNSPPRLDSKLSSYKTWHKSKQQDFCGTEQAGVVRTRQGQSLRRVSKSEAASAHAQSPKSDNRAERSGGP